MMRWNIINGCFGLLASAWTYFVSIQTDVEATARCIGEIAGAVAALISVAIAVRAWRRGEHRNLKRHLPHRR